jgi:hypothetical protein
MSDCTLGAIEFPPVKKRRIEANFGGGEVSSNGGVLLLRQVDRRVGLLDEVARRVVDPRSPHLVRHPLASLLKQRVYALCLGHEDLNDHHELRRDTLLQTAAERDEELGSSATLCRLENWEHHRASAWAIHEVILEHFIASFVETPAELVLDFDATDDPVHGRQEGRFFHGYYDHYCFLPLYVFCGEQLLVSYLRPAKIDAAKHAWAILALLVKRLRRAWPKVRIILRGDSGFCRQKMLNWCDRHGVGYCVGLAQNARLNARTQARRDCLKAQHEATRTHQRAFMEFDYAASSWRHPRRVIARLEYSDKGDNPRYVVASLEDEAQALYEQLYCGRGEMENRIKEAQLGLFADRTSCHYFAANQFRLMLASLAYILMERLRALALRSTEAARHQTQTIRLKLLKIGAVVIRNTRRIRVLLSSACPDQALFLHAVRALSNSS